MFDQKEIEFVLGEGETKGIVEGIEIALRKFKKGEKSRLKIKPKYAYGSKGCPDKNIPPDAELIYEVTLKEFEKVSWVCCMQQISLGLLRCGPTVFQHKFEDN